MSDPRPAVVGKRLADVARIIAFCSAKGGVGKTFCTVVSGLALAGAGFRVGLLDLDTQGASAHVFLGAAPRLPEEKEGILPLAVTERLSLMGVAPFTGNLGLPLRGPEVSDAILELLAVTRWGRADFLLIDMPPGIGEEVLDMARLVPRLQAVVVSTPSTISISVVERLLSVLSEIRVAVPGMIANMVDGDAGPVRSLAARHRIPLVGEVPLERAVERAIGSPEKLLVGPAAEALRAAMSSLGFL